MNEKYRLSVILVIVMKTRHAKIYLLRVRFLTFQMDEDVYKNWIPNNFVNKLFNFHEFPRIHKTHESVKEYATIGKDSKRYIIPLWELSSVKTVIPQNCALKIPVLKGCDECLRPFLLFRFRNNRLIHESTPYKPPGTRQNPIYLFRWAGRSTNPLARIIFLPRSSFFWRLQKAQIFFTE